MAYPFVVCLAKIVGFHTQLWYEKATFDKAIQSPSARLEHKEKCALKFREESKDEGSKIFWADRFRDRSIGLGDKGGGG